MSTSCGDICCAFAHHYSHHKAALVVTRKPKSISCSGPGLRFLPITTPVANKSAPCLKRYAQQSIHINRAEGDTRYLSIEIIPPGRFYLQVSNSLLKTCCVSNPDFPRLCNQHIVSKGNERPTRFSLQPAQTVNRGQRLKIIPPQHGREKLLHATSVPPIILSTVPAGTGRPSSGEKLECFFGRPLLGRGRSPPTP